ncbi:MAG TPA: hypothetical protein DEQ34_08925 [Balneolaceae bacterium]|nr:hypothetical protein [Balneolaceae bacterium]
MTLRSANIFLLFIVFTVASVHAQTIEQGVVQFENDQLSQAESTFRNILKQDKKNTQAMFYMGRIEFERKEYGDAADWFEEVLDKEPGSSLYHMWMGHANGRLAQNASVLRQAGYARKCRNSYQKAIELDPNNLTARKYLIDYYLQAPGFLGGGRDNAEKEATEIMNRDIEEGYLAWGRIYSYEKEFENWFQNYATAIKEHPELMAPYFELYNYYFGSEQFQNAADISRKQLSVNDTLSIAQENLQRALERLK